MSKKCVNIIKPIQELEKNLFNTTIKEFELIIIEQALTNALANVQKAKIQMKTNFSSKDLEMVH